MSQHPARQQEAGAPIWRCERQCWAVVRTASLELAPVGWDPSCYATSRLWLLTRTEEGDAACPVRLLGASQL